MVFRVEIVFNLCIKYDGMLYKSCFESLLEKYKISTYFFEEESDFINNKWSHNCVCHISFENNKDEVINFINFLEKVNILPHIYVENIYEDKTECISLFTSKNYEINNLHKINNSKNKSKRERSYSETEFLLLKSLQKICKKKFFKKNNIPSTYEDYLNILNSTT